MIKIMNSFLENSEFMQPVYCNDFKNLDLEQKIDLENKIRDGITRLLAACNHKCQTLEAAKNLLASNERMQSYAEELHDRGTNQSSHEETRSTARISFSDLRLPLIWKNDDHFKNRGDHRRFAVFCLVRIGSEIFDTSMISPVDRSYTDITFDDVIAFQSIPPNFEFCIEVYSHVLEDDFSIASTPRKIKETLHSSLSKTVGRKIAQTLKSECNFGLNCPRFQRIAHAKLKLSDTNNAAKAYDFKFDELVNPSDQLPLFGQFCCRISAFPDCLDEVVSSGFVICSWKPNQSPQRCWAVLKGSALRFWENETEWENVDAVKHEVCLTVNLTVRLEQRKREIKLVDSNNVILIHCLSDQNYSDWVKGLEKQQANFVTWRHCLENPMTVLTETVRKQLRYPRLASLYEEIPFKGNHAFVNRSYGFTLGDYAVEPNISRCSLVNEPVEIRRSLRLRSLSSSSRPSVFSFLKSTNSRINKT